MANANRSRVAADTFTYGLTDIMRRLGQPGHGDRWQVNYVTRLIAGAGFPPPLPLARGARLFAEVKAASRWNQRAVDRWFEDRAGPESASAAIAELRAGEQAMDDRARRLALRLVQGGRS